MMKRRWLPLAAAALFTLPALANAQPPVGTTTSMSFSPSSVVAVDDPVTVTGSVVVTSTSAAPVGGKLRLKRFLVNGVHVSCGDYAAAASGKSEEILDQLDPVNSGASTGSNSIQWVADTSLAGSFSYGAQFVNEGSGFATSQSGCVDLVVQDSCDPSGFSIGIRESTGSSSALPGTTYTGGFTVTVQNCGPETVPGVSAQGGTSGWTTYTGHLAEPPTQAWIRNLNKKNEVLYWDIGDMAPETSKDLKVFLTGTIKPKTAPGTIVFLSGEWSAQSNGVKTPYTGRVFITVDAPE